MSEPVSLRQVGTFITWNKLGETGWPMAFSTRRVTRTRLFSGSARSGSRNAAGLEDRAGISAPPLPFSTRVRRAGPELDLYILVGERCSFRECAQEALPLFERPVAIPELLIRWSSIPKVIHRPRVLNMC